MPNILVRNLTYMLSSTFENPHQIPNKDDWKT